MTIEVFDCEQGGDEWKRLRAGRPTASAFQTIMASGKGGGESLTRKKYLYATAGEVLTGDPAESFSSEAMNRGREMEAEARSAYSLITDQELTRVGFIINGRPGCSPDSLISDRGMLEIKTQRADLLIDRLLGNDSPSEHMPQLQGNLWLAEREWIDLVFYWPRLPLFKRRIKRDESYIARLKLAVSVFCEELDEIVEKVKRYGSAP